ncbi:MAG: hypothetical protein GY927_14860 [bacterium]|nr:hypothetical protein [bacterium]
MTQSSDRNDSKRNSEDGSTQAEQILDSIIEHIESTDEPVTGYAQTAAEVAQIDDTQADASPLDEQQNQEVSSIDSISDFNNIEQRAAALASRLGGAGLSYCVGVKMHLEQETDPDEGEAQQETPVVEAVIHHDDLDIDNEQFIIFDPDDPEFDGSEQGDLNEEEVNHQRQHVNEWADGLQAEGSVEAGASLEAEVLEADLNIPDTQLEMVGAPIAAKEEATSDHFETIEMMEQSEHSTEHDPDLQDIENNIGILSSSMNSENADPIDHETTVLVEPIIEVPAITNIAFEEMALRVTTLESKLVKILDDVSLSEQKVGDTVREIVHSQTQKAVHESLEMSEALGDMKSELANAAEQRHLQDVRMSDSLDALHDALKDIGDRVKTMESGSADMPHVPKEHMPTAGGIVSSVLGSSIGDSEYEKTPSANVPKAQLKTLDAELVSKDTREELPAWLSDSTHDMHAIQSDSPIESADVFARNSDLSEVLQCEVMGSDIQEVPAEDIGHENQKNQPATLNEEVLQPVKNVARPVVEPVVTVENVEQPLRERPVTDSDLEVQEPSGENNFLRSARAAARAANERARGVESPKATAKKEYQSITKNGSFVEAGEQMDKGVEPEVIVEKVRSTPKNSLFSDKVQGPNSLLVFTSLILFGTSALLLYGMSRENVDTGSVVKMNATQSAVRQQPTGPHNEDGVLRKSNPAGSKKANQDSNGERSELDSNVGVASAVQTNAESGSDTLTDQEKTNSSRTAVLVQGPDAIRYTGSTARSIGVAKPGALFEQYIGFSSPSPVSGPVDKISVKAGDKTKSPAKNDGLTNLLNSANSGNALAQYEVARRFGQGIGVQKSPAISVDWYEKSAKAGYAPAIYRLATMYERGKGVAKDYQRAMKLYISAAKKGNVKAMHNLAVLYTGGNLGKADYSNAINWYSKAAQYGVKDSQFNLAIIYQNGLGGKLDLDRAYKWYSLAARAGDKEAKGMVADLSRELSSAIREKLDKKLRIWKPKTPDKNANVVSHYRKASLHVGTGKKT